MFLGVLNIRDNSKIFGVFKFQRYSDIFEVSNTKMIGNAFCDQSLDNIKIAGHSMPEVVLDLIEDSCMLVFDPFYMFLGNWFVKLGFFP